MPAFRATSPADPLSFWSAVAAGVGCGGLMLLVAAPLVLSSPFPTPKERAWVVDTSPAAAKRAAAMGRFVEESIHADADAEPDAQTTTFAPSLAPRRAAASTDILVYEPTFILASLPMGELDDVESDADREPVGSIGPVISSMPRNLGSSEDIDDYLWEVYLRNPVKKDGSGDFTWKDPAAAKRAGLDLKDYVIRGMDKDFRETLYHMGKALDADGYNWSMLSAFRDDYRQSLASGLKARTGYSLHGGSKRTGGYGHGRAIDITTADGHNAEAVWHWVDRNGARFAIARPMPGYDPAHIQARGNWQQVAGTLRAQRTMMAAKRGPSRTAEATAERGAR